MSAIKWYDGANIRTLHGTNPGIPTPTPTASWDWSDANRPWSGASSSDWESRIPVGATVVDLQTASSDFWINLSNTVAAAGKRVIVRLPAGTFHLKSFRLIGTSGDPTYAFGFWFANLQGLVGAGPGQTFVQMDANSMSSAQLAALGEARFGWTKFAPLQMGFCRLDGTASSPVYLGGLTFQAADQQTTWSPYSDVPITTPTPAPHQGVVFYPDSYGVVSHVRFAAAGRALTAQPPFEMGNFNSQRGNIQWFNTEFDCRRAASIDPTQPRRCTPFLQNNEVLARMTDCWWHHSNTGRHAVNDQNRDTAALSTLYEYVRCKGDHITDETIAGTQQLPLSVFGFESTNAEIRITDCIVEQDNTKTSLGIGQHVEITYVGSRNPAGGRLTMTGGIFRNAGFPGLNGYRCLRVVSNTRWYLDGLANTVTITDETGARLQPYVYTGAWPPSASTLAAAGVSPSTHYIVRPS